jgi:hypothetical protein
MTVSTWAPEATERLEAPLFLEPVLGWRVWRLSCRGPGLRLQALATPDVWRPNEADAACCFVSDHSGAPWADCTCGYHGASSVDALMGAGVLGRGVAVLGAIAMWGTVIEHAQGARAEFAYPARLRLVCSPCFRAGSIVDPVTVAAATPLVPLCGGHWRSNGAGQLKASFVEAELLATYRVDVLPRQPTPSRRRRMRPARPGESGEPPDVTGTWARSCRKARARADDRTAGIRRRWVPRIPRTRTIDTG